MEHYSLESTGNIVERMLASNNKRDKTTLLSLLKPENTAVFIPLITTKMDLTWLSKADWRAFLRVFPLRNVIEILKVLRNSTEQTGQLNHACFVVHLDELPLTLIQIYSLIQQLTPEEKKLIMPSLIQQIGEINCDDPKVLDVYVETAWRMTDLLPLKESLMLLETCANQWNYYRFVIISMEKRKNNKHTDIPLFTALLNKVSFLTRHENMETQKIIIERLHYFPDINTGIQWLQRLTMLMSTMLKNGETERSKKIHSLWTLLAVVDEAGIDNVIALHQDNMENLVYIALSYICQNIHTKKMVKILLHPDTKLRIKYCDILGLFTLITQLILNSSDPDLAKALLSFMPHFDEVEIDNAFDKLLAVSLKTLEFYKQNDRDFFEIVPLLLRVFGTKKLLKHVANYIFNENPSPENRTDCRWFFYVLKNISPEILEEEYICFNWIFYNMGNSYSQMLLEGECRDWMDEFFPLIESVLKDKSTKEKCVFHIEQFRPEIVKQIGNKKNKREPSASFRSLPELLQNLLAQLQNQNQEQLREPIEQIIKKMQDEPLYIKNHSDFVVNLLLPAFMDELVLTDCYLYHRAFGMLIDMLLKTKQTAHLPKVVHQMKKDAAKFGGCMLSNMTVYEVIEPLLQSLPEEERSCLLDEKNQAGQNAIHLMCQAAKEGFSNAQRKAVAAIIYLGTNINSADNTSHQRYPLHYYLLNNAQKKEDIQLLLHGIKDIPAVLNQKITNSNCGMELIMSANTIDAETLAYLLEQGMSPYIEAEYFRPIDNALGNMRVDLAEVFYKKGVPYEIDPRIKIYPTPLSLHLHSSYRAYYLQSVRLDALILQKIPEVTWLLLQHEKKESIQLLNEHKTQVIEYAIALGDCRAVEKCLSLGVDPSYVSQGTILGGYSLLAQAIIYGRNDLIELLLNGKFAVPQDIRKKFPSALFFLFAYYNSGTSKLLPNIQPDLALACSYLFKQTPIDKLGSQRNHEGKNIIVTALTGESTYFPVIQEAIKIKLDFNTQEMQQALTSRLNSLHRSIQGEKSAKNRPEAKTALSSNILAYEAKLFTAMILGGFNSAVLDSSLRTFLLTSILNFDQKWAIYETLIAQNQDADSANSPILRVWEDEFINDPNFLVKRRTCSLADDQGHLAATEKKLFTFWIANKGFTHFLTAVLQQIPLQLPLAKQMLDSLVENALANTDLALALQKINIVLLSPSNKNLIPVLIALKEQLYLKLMAKNKDGNLISLVQKNNILTDFLAWLPIDKAGFLSRYAINDLFSKKAYVLVPGMALCLLNQHCSVLDESARIHLISLLNDHEKYTFYHQQNNAKVKDYIPQSFVFKHAMMLKDKNIIENMWAGFSDREKTDYFSLFLHEERFDLAVSYFVKEAYLRRDFTRIITASGSLVKKFLKLLLRKEHASQVQLIFCQQLTDFDSLESDTKNKLLLLFTQHDLIDEAIALLVSYQELPELDEVLVVLRRINVSTFAQEHKEALYQKILLNKSWQESLIKHNKPFVEELLSYKVAQGVSVPLLSKFFWEAFHAENKLVAIYWLNKCSQEMRQEIYCKIVENQHIDRVPILSEHHEALSALEKIAYEKKNVSFLLRWFPQKIDINFVKENNLGWLKMAEMLDELWKINPEYMCHLDPSIEESFLEAVINSSIPRSKIFCKFIANRSCYFFEQKLVALAQQQQVLGEQRTKYIKLISELRAQTSLNDFNESVKALFKNLRSSPIYHEIPTPLLMSKKFPNLIKIEHILRQNNSRSFSTCFLKKCRNNLEKFSHRMNIASQQASAFFSGMDYNAALTAYLTAWNRFMMFMGNNHERQVFFAENRLLSIEIHPHMKKSQYAYLRDATAVLNCFLHADRSTSIYYGGSSVEELFDKLDGIGNHQNPTCVSPFLSAADIDIHIETGPQTSYEEFVKITDEWIKKLKETTGLEPDSIKRSEQHQSERYCSIKLAGGKIDITIKEHLPSAVTSSAIKINCTYGDEQFGNLVFMPTEEKAEHPVYMRQDNKFCLNTQNYAFNTQLNKYNSQQVLLWRHFFKTLLRNHEKELMLTENNWHLILEPVLNNSHNKDFLRLIMKWYRKQVFHTISDPNVREEVKNVLTKLSKNTTIKLDELFAETAISKNVTYNVGVPRFFSQGMQRRSEPGMAATSQGSFPPSTKTRVSGY